MLTVLGIILIALGVALIAAPAVLSKKVAESRVLERIPLAVKGLVILIGIFLTFITSLFFYAEPGYSYLVQYVSGQQLAVLDAGPKLKLFGNVIPFKKVITVKFSNTVEGKVSGKGESIQIRFNDAVTADVDAVCRFRLPTEKEFFKRMALDFRSQENLIVASLIPVSREAIRNSGRMISAQEYIVGKGGEFENAVLDQLQNGIYILETQELVTKKEDSAIREEGERVLEGKETVQYKVNIATDAEGNYKRKAHTFSEYSIMVSQATVEKVDMEQKFKDMIGQQRDAAAEANIERQKAKKAEYEKQRIIAEGETEKAKTKVEKEKEQVEILITAETERKKQEELVKTRELELRAKKLEAQSIQVMADAEAYKKRKIMQADGALELKLKALVQINQAYAGAIKGSALVPEVQISGSDGNNSTSMDLIQLLTAQTARQLKLDLTPQ